jgi:hypothetical protein
MGRILLHQPPRQLRFRRRCPVSSFPRPWLLRKEKISDLQLRLMVQRPWLQPANLQCRLMVQRPSLQTVLQTATANLWHRSMDPRPWLQRQCPLRHMSRHIPRLLRPYFPLRQCQRLQVQRLHLPTAKLCYRPCYPAPPR